jgi:HEAT repeat protein
LVSDEPEVSQVATEVNQPSFESEIEINFEDDSEAESSQPLETWQLSYVEEPALIDGVEEMLEPVAATADQASETEEPALEFETEFDLQAELSRLEAEASMSVFEGDQKSVDVTNAETGIQSSSAKPARLQFIEGLQSSDSATRAATFKEMAKLDESEAFGLITSMFDDSSEEVRSQAARALHEFKPDRAASFTRALREGSVERRRKIAAAINTSGLAREAIDCLAGESREKTYDAFSILFLMAKAGEVQTLLQTIEKHPDVAVRLSVIRLLTFSNQPDIIPAFRSLAVRGSLPTEVRSAVMEAIYQISRNARENSISAA